MGRLIVVSNRVDLPRDSGANSVGGLAAAMAAALRDSNGIWFGWSGETTETYSGQLTMHRVGAVTLALVDLTEEDRQNYYNGYANKTLWPLFHDRTDLAASERAFEDAYARVNQNFAKALLPLIERDDLIWIQDYHLIPLARDLRRLGVQNRIGFFLHIPWPARSHFLTLLGHEDLVEAMFSNDVVGFQTDESREAFQDYVLKEIPGAKARGKSLTAFGRSIVTDTFPIGIDPDGFAEALNTQAGQAQLRRMQTSLADRRMILGVDRLDYSKGLEERFLAYEQFLVDNPDQHEQVFLLQIATPSRGEVAAYQEIRARLDGISGRINGAFATVDWVPIRYVNRSHRRDELAAIYRSASVGLVTPLRDGMNLVAKEYVAAQDPADPGVLILSQFAGAAAQLREALIINPHSREQTSEAIRQALLMPKKERIERWEALITGLRRDNVGVWRDAFLAALRPPPARAMPAGADIDMALSS